VSEYKAQSGRTFDSNAGHGSPVAPQANEKGRDLHLGPQFVLFLRDSDIEHHLPRNLYDREAPSVKGSPNVPTPTPDRFRFVSRFCRTRRAQDGEVARLHLRRDEPTDAVPAKGMPAWLDAYDRFFQKRVHAHPAVECCCCCCCCALRGGRKLCALCEQQAALFVVLVMGLGQCGMLAARRVSWVCVCPWGPSRAALCLISRLNRDLREHGWIRYCP
jgi:hypothetical protein